MCVVPSEHLLQELLRGSGQQQRVSDLTYPSFNPGVIRTLVIAKLGAPKG